MLTGPRAVRPSGCISDLAFDEWLAGELDGDRAAELEAHVATCARCTERRRALEEQARAFLARRPDRPRRRARWTRSGVWVSGTAAVLVAAAAVLLFSRGLDPGDGTRLKGGGARLGFHVKRGDGVFRGSPGERLRPGDVLRFSVSTPRARHAAILGLDARGVASVYHPVEASRSLGPGAEVPLETAVELDATLGPERFFLVLCDGPIAVSSLKGDLERDGRLEPPEGCDLDTVRVVKEPPP